jgi:hypothetical protein
MVGSSSESADSVEASRKSSSHLGGESTISIAIIVNALEEVEPSRIQRLCWVETCSVLNSNMAMTDDPTLSIKVLRSSVVGTGSIGEESEGHVLDLDCDVEIRVLYNLLVVLRVEDHCRHHPAGRRNPSHGYKRVSILSYASCRWILLTDAIARAIL